ncbi:alpha-2-macroglobulin [Camelimonas abortus]
MALAGGLFPDHVSSPLSVAAAQAQPARRDGAPAAAPYAREDLASDAVRLEARLKREAGEGARRPLAQLRSAVDAALARRQWDAALAAARDAVAGHGADAGAMALYARAALAAAQAASGDGQPAPGLNPWRLRGDAAAAAYAAYQRAPERAPRAAHLALLGAALAAAGAWRPALDAYAASLALENNPAVAETWRALRERRGFRVTGYRVDSDSASPRACFTFSDPLARGRVDFAPYVAVTGAAGAAVSAEDSQLCVDGLKHGQSYGVVLRQGLPSAVGETLLANADYQIYVRDRAPSVRFTGRNYVLPRMGQEGIPVVSVNTSAVQIELARIGDRALLPTVRSGSFLSQLSRHGIDQVIDTTGQKIWSGELEVKSPQLNADVITAFPVHAAVGRLQPGVYVMTARPAAAAPLAGDDDYGDRATQWFVVSDLGLTAVSTDNGVRVLVRSLATARPVAGVEVRLLARNNEVLATRATGPDGGVTFDPGLARGRGGMAPGMVVASGPDGDYNFLDLEQTPFDLTDRGDRGRPAPGALDAYVFPERGVYRPGETAFITAMLRDNRGIAVTGAPLTLVVRRPDGVEYRRDAVKDEGLGGRSLAVPLLSGAQAGVWRVLAYADPRGEPVGETAFLVEDYTPERLEVTATPAAAALKPGAPARIDVAARYLYGAPGSGLALSGEVTVGKAEASAVKGLEGYAVGVDSEEVEPATAEFDDLGRTDGAGRAGAVVPVPEVTAARPLQAKVTLRVSEDGGRAVARTVTLPILPAGPVIGVKKLFGDLSAGAMAAFDVVMAQPDGTRLRKRLRWSLYRVERRYQWFNAGGSWNFEPVKTTRRVADGTVETTPEAPARVAAPVDWGAWRLEVAADDGEAALTSVSFGVGYGGEGGADVPDALELTLNRPDQSGGEVLEARIRSGFAGTATLMVVTDRVAHEQAVSLDAGGTTVKVPVRDAWGPGAWALAFAHRPLDVEARRMPGRAVGLAWFSVDRASRELAVKLETPAQIRPRGQLAVPVTLAGLQPGEEAFVTVAAVDVGILNLTRYEPPQPQAHYLGQRRLGAAARDLYGYLIDGMQGAPGALRSGGDAAVTMHGDPPTQAPLARYSGVVKVGPDGRAVVTFDIPAFNGALRVMATAWSARRVGSASADVIVRDPVAILPTAPRFLAIGDRSRVHVKVDNVDGPAGDYEVTVTADGPAEAPAGALKRRVTLARGAAAAFDIPVVARAPGVASFAIAVKGQGVEAEQTVSFRVQPGQPALARRMARPLPPGAAVELGADLLATIVPGTGVASVAATRFAALDAPALLQALETYPYGCTEQTVSRALPLLQADAVAAMRPALTRERIDAQVNEAIARVLSRQDSAGSFGLWAPGGDDLWLDAYVADFLTRARERGYAVPQQPFLLALERLRNAVASLDGFSRETSDGLAYAVYVLARNGRPVMGDLRYLADTKLDEFATPLGRAQVAAALALLGDRVRAAAAFARAAEALAAGRDDGWRPDYGSRLRDGAALIALAMEAGMDGATVQKAVAVVDGARAVTARPSTQENAWLLMAAMAMEKESRRLRLSVDGAERSGPLFASLDAAALAKPVRIVNTGDVPAQLVITVSGNPSAPEPPLARGYRIERGYYRLDGTRVDPARVRQNERLVVMLRITEQETRDARLLVVDHLPAGLEIENPKLVDGAALPAFAFADADRVEPAATEYRDDRFVAAYERRQGQPAFINVGYVVRVASPGAFVHPPAVVEDMYRPDRFGRTASGMMTVEPATSP